MSNSRLADQDGRKDEDDFWRAICGYLDLSGQEFLYLDWACRIGVRRRGGCALAARRPTPDARRRGD